MAGAKRVIIASDKRILAKIKKQGDIDLAELGIEKGQFGMSEGFKAQEKAKKTKNLKRLRAARIRKS